jgi:integration host factor subunit alpha
MTLTKSDLISCVFDQCGVSKTSSAELVETVLEIIKDTLASGEDVLISGFGKFCVQEKGERLGRNPATGDDLMLRARKRVTFSCSQRLRDRINGKG